MYVELHSCSAFSFLEGASLPEDLVSEAARLELPAIALLDRDGVYGSPRFHMAAKKAGIRAHVGAEISVEGCGTQAGMPSWMPNKIPSRPVRLALLAKNRTGYQNLCRLMTRYKLREKESLCRGSAPFRSGRRNAQPSCRLPCRGLAFASARDQRSSLRSFPGPRDPRCVYLHSQPLPARNGGTATGAKR